MTDCVRGSRLVEILRPRGIRSLCDPSMGLPAHLNELKRNGIAVEGADTMEWLVSAGAGIVANDATLLRDDEIATIVEMVPGTVYALSHFAQWEGASLDEERCRYLAVWRENVRRLRSDAQIGLAVLALWRVFCYWHAKALAPDDMEDVAPSELAWYYLHESAHWIGSNGKRNTVRRSNALEATAQCGAEALLLAHRSHGGRGFDPRFAMWEAWWRGNPFSSLEEDAAPLGDVLAAAGKVPTVVVLADERTVSEATSLLASSRRSVERLDLGADEIYLIAERAARTEPR